MSLTLTLPVNASPLIASAIRHSLLMPLGCVTAATRGVVRLSVSPNSHTYVAPNQHLFYNINQAYKPPNISVVAGGLV
jgi:hypothetical protein